MPQKPQSHPARRSRIAFESARTSVPATVYGVWNGFAMARTTIDDAVRLLESTNDFENIYVESRRADNRGKIVDGKITAFSTSTGETETIEIRNREADFDGGWALVEV